MIQFDFCIFFRWVGEKPPTSPWVSNHFLRISLETSQVVFAEWLKPTGSRHRDN